MTTTEDRSDRRIVWARDEGLHRWVPNLLALLVAIVGINDVTLGIGRIHRRVHRVSTILPLAWEHAAVAASIAGGLVLLLVARGLHRRKRRAWTLAVAVLSIAVLLDLLRGPDLLRAGAGLLMLGLLIGFRKDFYAVGDPTTRWRALSTFLTLVALSVTLAVVLILFNADSFVGHYSFGQKAQEVLYGLVGVQGPLIYRSGRLADLFGDILGALGVLIAAGAFALFLRAPEPTARLAVDDEQRLRELLSAQGSRDSLGYFALRRDKSVIFSATGKAAIPYRVVAGVMLTSGDPVGDPEAWPGAIARYFDEARRHAWTPAVIGCSELGGEVWTRHGLVALELGDEAILELDEFSLEGRAMRNVRQAVGRVERAGYRADVMRVRDLPAERIAELRRQAEQWRGTDTERGFSMALGRFADPADGDCVFVAAMQVAEDGSERLRAFLHFVPWGEDGLSLDVMRRDSAADNGLNEFLIVSAVRAAERLGVARISLNFAVFRSALERGEKLGAGPLSRAWRGVLMFASRWFQIESLYRFNAKFRPVWEPRFVCYPSAARLPSIILAGLEAEAFISRPRATVRGFVRWVRRG